MSMGICKSKEDARKKIVCMGPIPEHECKTLLRTLPTFTPRLLSATCIKVTDGDSIRVRARIACDPMLKFYQFVLRLNGIDTPELRSSCDYEKKFARMAKKRLENLILGRFVEVKIMGRGKYGRLLAVVKQYHSTESVNKILLDESFAVEYMGGQRKKRNTQDFKRLILENSEIVRS